MGLGNEMEETGNKIEGGGCWGPGNEMEGAGKNIEGGGAALVPTSHG